MKRDVNAYQIDFHKKDLHDLPSDRVRNLANSIPHLGYLYLKTIRKNANAEDLRSVWQRMTLHRSITKLIHEQQQSLVNSIITPQINLNVLPPYSAVFQLQIQLIRPFLSKDETSFYIIDNPIQKEKIFRLPYVPATGWKGALSHAIQGRDLKRNGNLIALFGNDRGEEDTDQFSAGRLMFFPTFFEEVGLEIINPHDRKRKVGKNPILYESVPEKAIGTFTLLYVPYDQPLSAEILSDWEILRDSLAILFLEQGFGAKTSSGYGTAKILGGDRNTFSVRKEVVQKLGLPKEVNEYLADYGNEEDFHLSPREWRRQPGSKKSRQELDDYENAWNAFQEYQSHLANGMTDSTTWWFRKFSTLDGPKDSLDACLKEIRVGMLKENDLEASQ